MAHQYRPDLLAPYLALPQGEKIQAECMFDPSSHFIFNSGADLYMQTFGLTVMVVSVVRHV
jgi:hypothetical protein